MISKALINTVKENFKLDLKGIHGTAHWVRVLLNGRTLHRLSDAGDLTVIELFAFIHDSQRLHDGRDADHGPRAAQFAIEQCGKLFVATDNQLRTLVTACNGHTSQHLSDDITVQICWDSDRLDIGRCTEFVDPYYLGTDAAKSILEPSIIRSRK